MPLKDQEGLTAPDYEVDIERGKIREFARAMQATLPDFMTGQNPVIPATYLVSAPYTWGYSLERPRGTVFADIDHDLTVSLHAEESFVFHGPPPRAGDRLMARAMLESVREKQGASGGKLTFLTMLTEYRERASGTLRAEQRSVSVTTSQEPGGGNWDVTLPDYQPDHASLEPDGVFSGIDRQSWRNLAEGSGPGAINAGKLLLRDIVRFQGVIGEDDPLHYDAAWARRQNYPSPFGLGMHQASLMASYAAHWLPPEAVHSYRVRFRDMVWPGDELVYDGQILHKDHEARTAEAYLTCSRAGGGLVDEAWMTFDFTEIEEQSR